MVKVLGLFFANKLIGFLFVGSFNTMMALTLYTALLWLEIDYILASCISFIFGVFEGYILNSLLVFKTRPQFKSLLRFSLVYCISLLLNLVMMYLQVEYLHLGKLVAQIITSLVLAMVNFYLIKIFVYRLRAWDL